MTDRAPSMTANKPASEVLEPEAGAVFEPYESRAGGWGALRPRRRRCGRRALC
jgi:hypothetical protein